MVKMTKYFAKVTGANMDALKLGYGTVSEYRSNTVATLAQELIHSWKAP